MSSVYEGTHEGCPYGGRRGMGVVARTWAPTRGAPTGDGGVWESWRVRGRPQGVPLRGMAGYGSRGAYVGAHKGCPYGGWRGMGVVARTWAPTRGAPTGDGGVWESWRVRGRPQGVPLRGMAGYGSRGAYVGAHKGCPYGGWRGMGVVARTWAPTRGAPTGDGGVWESWRVRGRPQGVPLRGMTGYGSRGAYAHKGCPYGG